MRDAAHFSLQRAAMRMHRRHARCFDDTRCFQASGSQSDIETIESAIYYAQSSYRYVLLALASASFNADVIY